MAYWENPIGGEEGERSSCTQAGSGHPPPIAGLFGSSDGTDGAPILRMEPSCPKAVSIASEDGSWTGRSRAHGLHTPLRDAGGCLGITGGGMGCVQGTAARPPAGRCRGLARWVRDPANELGAGIYRHHRAAAGTRPFELGCARWATVGAFPLRSRQWQPVLRELRPAESTRHDRPQGGPSRPIQQARCSAFREGCASRRSRSGDEGSFVRAIDRHRLQPDGPLGKPRVDQHAPGDRATGAGPTGFDPAARPTGGGISRAGRRESDGGSRRDRGLPRRPRGIPGLSRAGDGLVRQGFRRPIFHLESQGSDGREEWRDRVASVPDVQELARAAHQGPSVCRLATHSHRCTRRGHRPATPHRLRGPGHRRQARSPDDSQGRRCGVLPLAPSG